MNFVFLYDTCCTLNMSCTRILYVSVLDACVGLLLDVVITLYEFHCPEKLQNYGMSEF